MGLYEDMRVFEKVCKYENFSKAAKALNMSSSSVSKAVKRFEETTGQSLLNRNTHKIALTSVGRAYFEKSQSIVVDLEALKSKKNKALSTSKSLKLTFCHESKDIFSTIQKRLANEKIITDNYQTLIFNTSTDKENFDFISSHSDFYIFLGTPRISNLIARKLVPINLSLYLPKDTPYAKSRTAVHANFYNTKEGKLNFDTDDDTKVSYISDNYFDIYKSAIENNYAVYLPDFFEIKLLEKNFVKSNDEIKRVVNINEGIYLIYAMRSLKTDSNTELINKVLDCLKSEFQKAKI